MLGYCPTWLFSYISDCPTTGTTYDYRWVEGATMSYKPGHNLQDYLGYIGYRGL